MPKTNYVAFILNAHLPYVRHLEYPRFLEEDWLYEAISETYLPMIRMLNRIADDQLPVRLVISVSPTLATMLGDEPLQERFLAYLQKHIELGQKEVQRTASEQREYAEMAQEYLNRYQSDLEDFEACGHNILESFRRLEERGVVQLITTAATHAYLPLYQEFPAAINAQVDLGIKSHLENFGRMTRGFWLPECGYFPGLERYLKVKGVQWFQCSSQSMLLSPDRVDAGNLRPIRCPNGVAAFPRDYELTSLVWSNTEGYPCDPRYREFYRDIGYDLPMDYIRDYIDASGQRIFTGYKYCAITGMTNEKAPYVPSVARDLVKVHASNFLYNVQDKARRTSKLVGEKPFFTLAFDCELFGHWWYEGIDWLEQVLRQSCTDACTTEMTTPSLFLETKPNLQTARPAYSSWGVGGFSSTLLDGSNQWIYRHVFEAIKRMGELAERFPDQTSLKRRFLNQAAREVLLSMASDWPFIMYSKSDAAYAKKRFEGHLENFNVVYSNMCKNAVNTEWLVKAERKDLIFKDINYNIFRG